MACGHCEARRRMIAKAKASAGIVGMVKVLPSVIRSVALQVSPDRRK